MWDVPYLNSLFCDKVNRCKELKNILKDKNLQDVDFSFWAQNLNENEKEQLYQLLNIDMVALKKQFEKQKNIIYVAGYNGPNRQKDLNQAVVYQKWCSKFKLDENGKPYQWFFKPHPGLFAPILDELRKSCPNAIEISAYIPFEVLLIANIRIHKVAGFGSSLFFSLDKKDVLYYIIRDSNDGYLFLLKKN